MEDGSNQNVEFQDATTFDEDDDKRTSIVRRVRRRNPNTQKIRFEQSGVAALKIRIVSVRGVAAIDG
jgi:hypothetical protein